MALVGPMTSSRDPEKTAPMMAATMAEKMPYLIGSPAIEAQVIPWMKATKETGAAARLSRMRSRKP